MYASYIPLESVQNLLFGKTSGKNKISALVSLLRLLKSHVNFPFP